VTIEDGKRIIAVGCYIIGQGFTAPRRCQTADGQTFHYSGSCSSLEVNLYEGSYPIKTELVGPDRWQLFFQSSVYRVELRFSGRQVQLAEDMYHGHRYQGSQIYLSGRQVTIDSQTFKFS